MIAALVYLKIHSLKNRIRSQVRRLRKPKYLAGGMVGVLYIYFFFLRQFLFQRGPFPMASSHIPGEYRWLVESLAAGLLLVIVMLSWITPRQRAALAFTEAEIALARDGAEFLAALWPALVLMALHYGWVMWPLRKRRSNYRASGPNAWRRRGPATGIWRAASGGRSARLFGWHPSDRPSAPCYGKT